MIFISHSRTDLDVAKELEANLLRAGRRSWLDASQIPVGERFVRAIAKAMNQSALVVMIDSDNFRRSYWCRREQLTSIRLRKLGRVNQLISLQLTAREASRFHVDHLVTSVAETVALVGRLYPHAHFRTPVQDPHSVVFEEDRSSLVEPVVWLGFSDALAAFDNWWMGETSGIWVTGFGGQGKTSLALTWIRALELLGYREAVQVRGLILSYYEDPSASRWLRRLDSWLCAESHESRLIFMDGTERLSDNDLLTTIRAVHGAGARFIVTSRREAPAGLTPKPSALRLSPMSSADVTLLLQKHDLDPSKAQRLIDNLHGHPLSLTVAAMALKSTTIDDLLRAVDAANDRQQRRSNEGSEDMD